MKLLLDIYWSFFKMSGVTFGGGYAMLPILKSQVVAAKNWLSEEELLDYYAMSQALPGIIAVNVSIFTGYQLKKISGAIAAALGVVSPCIIIITILANFLTGVMEVEIVSHALAGISICVCALISHSLIGMWKKGVKDKITMVICIITLILSVVTDLSPIVFIITSAVIGIIAQAKKLGGAR